MSVIGKKTQRRTVVPMKMVTKVKPSKKVYNRKTGKSKIRKTGI